MSAVALVFSLLLTGNPFYGPNCAQPQPRRPGADVAEENMRNIRPRLLPELLVFVKRGCRACTQWQKDFAPNSPNGRWLQERVRVRVIDIGKYPAFAQEHGVEQAPVFITGRKRLEGYDAGPNRVSGFATWLQTGTRAQPALSPTATTPTPLPTPTPVVAADKGEIRREFERLHERIEQLQQNPADLAKQITIRLPASMRGINKDELNSAISPVTTHLEEMRSVLQMLPGREVVREVSRHSTLIELLGISPTILAILGIGVSTGGVGSLAFVVFKVVGGIFSLMCRRRSATRQAPPAASTAPKSAAPVILSTEHPPIPQAVYTETQFTPVETDSYAKAHAWAQQEIGRKYPSAVSTLELENSLIKQHLSGQQVGSNK